MVAERTSERIVAHRLDVNRDASLARFDQTTPRSAQNLNQAIGGARSRPIFRTGDYYGKISRYTSLMIRIGER
jgi:hypothetical protein